MTGPLDVLRGANYVAWARRHAGPDGRLPVPESASWEIFPYEGEFRVKILDDPTVPEPPRAGENGAGCRVCSRRRDEDVWSDAFWRLTQPAAAEGIPGFLLEPVAHVDLGDLDENQAAQLGILTVRIERALMSIPGIGRVHVNRWGDGGAHLHIWFFARPEGVMQLRGSCLPDWLDILPSLPDETWQALRDHVRRALDSD